MNVLLWVLQGLLAVLYLMGGGAKVFMFDKIADGVASNQALSRGAWTGIGIFELVCAVALVAPAVTRTVSPVAPIAAACLAVEALLVAGLHYAYVEYSPAVSNLVLASVALFVSYGRLALRPL